MSSAKEMEASTRIAGPAAGFEAGIGGRYRIVARRHLSLCPGRGIRRGFTRLSAALPEIRFAVVFIGGEQNMYGPAQYQFPANVTHVETHYLLRQD